MEMKNEFLRHTLSTIDYRFQKSISLAEIGFGDFKAGDDCRTPNEILNHMYHVLSNTRIFIAEERYDKVQPEPLALNEEITRFNKELKELDKLLTKKALDLNYAKRLMQGPFSDILTHIGQISMLSGLNGNSIKGEDFSSAKIDTGIV